MPQLHHRYEDRDVAYSGKPSGAWHDNATSLSVTRKLGYEDNGDEILDREGTAERMLRFALSRDAWAQGRHDDITILGLEPCRAILGAAPEGYPSS